MLLYLASGRLSDASIFCFRALSYDTRYGVRVIAYASIFDLRAVRLCLYILLQGVSHIKLDQVSGRIAYASLFGVRAASLSTFCLRARSLL